MSRHTLVKAGALILTLTVASAPLPVLAFSDSGSGGSSAPELKCTPPKVPNADKTRCVPCPNGTEYSTTKKVCITKNASLMDDRTLYVQGRTLALAGYYRDALETFAAIGNKNDAMVLTMMGYATRKLGDADTGIALYHQALAIDPDNVNTHEYLGEGYLTQGRIDLAEVELNTLERLCGTACEQYQDLLKAMDGGSVWN
jgi:tetratricopeptide (TPR) repeat protein